MPALYIETEQDEPGFETYVNGKALSKHEGELDQIARRLGVTPLMEFFSVSPEECADFMEAHGGDPSGIEVEDEVWHEAGAGLVSVRALRDYLATHPESVSNVAGVRADLDEFERVLQSAEAHGIRWHLAVDF